MGIIQKMPYEKRRSMFETRLNHLVWYSYKYLENCDIILRNVDEGGISFSAILLGFIRQYGLFKKVINFLEIAESIDVVKIFIFHFLRVLFSNFFLLPEQIFHGSFCLVLSFQGIDQVFPFVYFWIDVFLSWGALVFNGFFCSFHLVVMIHFPSLCAFLLFVHFLFF